MERHLGTVGQEGRMSPNHQKPAGRPKHLLISNHLHLQPAGRLKHLLISNRTRTVAAAPAHLLLLRTGLLRTGRQTVAIQTAGRVEHLLISTVAAANLPLLRTGRKTAGSSPKSARNAAIGVQSADSATHARCKTVRRMASAKPHKLYAQT